MLSVCLDVTSNLYFSLWALYHAVSRCILKDTPEDFVLNHSHSKKLQAYNGLIHYELLFQILPYCTDLPMVRMLFYGTEGFCGTHLSPKDGDRCLPPLQMITFEMKFLGFWFKQSYTLVLNELTDNTSGSMIHPSRGLLSLLSFCSECIFDNSFISTIVEMAW